MLNVYKADRRDYNMLLYDSTGKLYNIKRCFFTTDTAYYQEILRYKNIKLSKQNRDIIGELVSLIKGQK